ncbi:hypothetical protein KEG38_23710 [Polyangium jinanense]|uniref:hypothetical protein n=1 Tax=Polyangium jinanense TaxID=2829994 RepID=UPI00233F83F9|nr:hypothetical protein [Polyangium jinanense]MDC3956887.1 hypothetical protein [Polyangium jinanense]
MRDRREEHAVREPLQELAPRWRVFRRLDERDSHITLREHERRGERSTSSSGISLMTRIYAS